MACLTTGRQRSRRAAGKVAALITSVLGAAMPCRRAARLGVSPSANCSCRVPPPPHPRPPARYGCPGAPPGVPPLLLQAGIELAHGLHDPEPGPHGPLGVIFVRQGIAEVDEQAIAEILRDMPSKRAITLAQVS